VVCPLDGTGPAPPGGARCMLEAETPRHPHHPSIAWGSIAIPVERDEPPAAVAAAFLDPRQRRGGAADATERLHAASPAGWVSLPRSCCNSAALQPAYDAPKANNRPEEQDPTRVREAGRTEGPAAFPPAKSSALRRWCAWRAQAAFVLRNRESAETGALPPPRRKPRPARAALGNRTPWPGRGTYVESRVSTDRVTFSTASPQRRPQPTVVFT
jgi:hypothetical protein